MLFGFRKTTLYGHLFRLREVAEESLIDLGPVNLGVDHLVVDNLLLPWGHYFLRVEPQRVEAWMECSSPFPPCLPFPSLGRLSFIKDVIRSNRGYYLEDGDDELFVHPPVQWNLARGQWNLYHHKATQTDYVRRLCLNLT